MTRTSRTLLILVLMSIGTVVVLAMMAQRYSRVLEDRQKAGRDAPRPGRDGIDALPDADAARYVAGYLEVMGTLKRTIAAMDEQTPTGAAVAELRAVFERALAEAGMDRTGFQEMDGVIRAWEVGSTEVPDAYRRELDLRAAEVRASWIEGYDPLER